MKVWDYDVNELKKSERGRQLLLERQINYGVSDGEKIKLSEVRKYWGKLDIGPRRRKLFEMLLKRA